MAAHRKHSFWFPLLGLGFALAGADKLVGAQGYENLFQRWGWRKDTMRAVGLAEFLGGVLVATRRYRQRGGMLLTAASTAVLTKEVSRQDTALAAPRVALLLASVAALFAGQRPRRRRR